MADDPNERDLDAEAAALTSNLDQGQAAFAGMGRALASMRRELIAGGTPRRMADRILVDVAHQWAAGTFNKPAGITIPGLGGR